MQLLAGNILLSAAIIFTGTTSGKGPKAASIINSAYLLGQVQALDGIFKNSL